MARTGLDKTDVKRARDVLLAQNRYPSVDAIRIELGNTGSKTTIHKYLKELEEQDGAHQTNVNLSEALQQMVASLAEQILIEADEKIQLVKQQALDREQQLESKLSELRNQLDETQSRLSREEVNLSEITTSHEVLSKNLQLEIITKHSLEQQVTDLKELLSVSNDHKTSLEEKHKHAQRVLEHYREAMKEQREQDTRRHEQQLQLLQAEMRQLQQTIIVKQDQVSTLSTENTKLSIELSHCVDNLSQLEKTKKIMSQDIEKAREHGQALSVVLAEKEQLISMLNTQLTDVSQKNSTLNQSLNILEKDLISSQAKLESQQSVFTQLQAMLAEKQRVDSNG